MRALRRWIQFGAVLALIKVLIGTAALVLGNGVGDARQWLMFAHVATFAACGLLLLWGSSHDTRAAILGVAYLLVASTFADALVRVPAGVPPGIPPFAGLIMHIQVDALVPFLLWKFAREFPRVPGPERYATFFRRMLRLCVVVGVVLLAVNMFRSYGPSAITARIAPFLSATSRNSAGGIYWLSQFGLTIAAFATLLSRSRLAAPDERRRVSLLLFGLALGTAPTVLLVFLFAIFPRLLILFPLRVTGWVIYPALLSTPFTTAYAVLVHHALDVRLIVRRALQYLLARYSVVALATIPLIVVIMGVYRQRDASVAQLIATPTGVLLVALCGVGFLVMSFRSVILERLDHAFFREQYDSRRVLGHLIEHCRAATNLADLSTTLEDGLDRALHLDVVHLLVRDARGRSLIALRGEVRHLDLDAPIARTLATGHAVDIDLEHPNAFVSTLVGPQIDWLTDSRFKRLVPLRDRQHQLIGALGLGEKRSELPLSNEDRELITLVVSAAEMTIGYQNLLPISERDAERDESDVAEALECSRCGVLQDDGSVCHECGGPTVLSIFPRSIGGKLRIERRIGAGAMGVVYRALDEQLGRAVAIKTLPQMSPAEAVRLRREARAVATVSHPNLALIFGAETWRGRPLLLFEYLTHGTLAQRLQRGPLSVVDTVELGLSLSSALSAIHAAGVLHRDIKPSNIGLTADGTVKLLDFGLARLLTPMADGVPLGAPLRVGSDASSTTDSLLQGTPRYMAPEALLGVTPQAGFDLWSLSVVVYECLTNVHPFQSADARILDAQHSIPDVRRHCPEAPPMLANLLERSLSLDMRDRPQSAADFRAALEAVRLAMGAAPGRPPGTGIQAMTPQPEQASPSRSPSL